MSLKTWKAEFYPSNAAKVSKENAVAHSLQKWRGLLPMNLEAHGMTVFGNGIGNGYGNMIRRLPITIVTCALCTHYFAPVPDYGDADYDADAPGPHVCPECPLNAVNGGRACDEMSEDGKLSPYTVWTARHDPKPMIALLEAAVEYEKKLKEPTCPSS